MGMDYVGRRPKNDRGQHLHLNWTGHSWLLSLLDQLGCDLSEWSGGNDGEHISARTCRSWAKVMRQTLAEGRIIEAVYTDKGYIGGERTMPAVRAGDEKSEPEPPHRGGQTAAIFAIRNICGKFDPDKSFKEYRPLDEGMQEWVEEIVAFFENCSGCRQW